MYYCKYIIHRVTRDYVGAIFIKLFNRMSVRKLPCLKRGTNGRLASTSEGEPPNCWEAWPHNSTSVAADP